MSWGLCYHTWFEGLEPVEMEELVPEPLSSAIDLGVIGAEGKSSRPDEPAGSAGEGDRKHRDTSPGVEHNG